MSTILVGAAAAQEIDPEVPSLEAEALDVEDLPGFLLDREGRAEVAVVRGESGFFRELQDQLVRDDFVRGFTSPDGQRRVTVELVWFRNRETAEAFTDPKGSLDPTPPRLPDGAIATFGGDEAEYAERASLLYQGGLAVRVETIAGGARAGMRAERLLEDATQAQFARLSPRPEIEGSTVDARRMQLDMTAAMTGVVLNLMLLLGFVTWARDPAARRRVRLRFTGRPEVPARAVDVEPVAKRRLRRHTWRVLIRAIVTLVVVTVGMLLPIGVIATVLVIVGALLSWGWVESRPGYLKQGDQERPKLFRGSALLAGGVGAALTSMLVVGGAALIWVGYLFEYFGVATLEPDQVSAIRTGMFLLALVLFALSVVPLQVMRRFAMRRMARLQEADDRPPVLLLRSFADDRVKIRARRTARFSFLDRFSLRRWDRFEAILAAELAPIGPVEAVGEPGTRLPPLGAVRRSYADGEWQGAVRERIAMSAMVVVIVGRTEFVRWEMHQLWQLGALDKTLFVIPPVAAAERRARLHALASAFGAPVEVLDVERPGIEVLAVVLADPSRPQLITGVARDDVSYEAAVRVGCDILERRAFPGLAEATSRAGMTWRPPSFRPAGPLWYPPGTAPRPKPWYRKPVGIIVLLALCTSTCSAVIDRMVPETAEITQVLAQGTSNRMLLTDAATGDLVAVMDGARGTEVLAVEGARTRRLGRLADHVVNDGVFSDGWVLVTSAAEDLVMGLDAASGESWTTPVGDAPRGVTVLADRAFVALAGANGIAELDLETGRLLRTVPVASAPWDVAVVSGDRLLVSLAASDELVTLSVPGLVERDRVVAPRAPRDVLVDGESTWVVGSARGELVGTEAGSSPRVLATTETAFPPVAVRDGRIGFPTEDGKGVVIIDGATGREVRTVRFDHELWTFAFGTDENLIVSYVGYNGIGVADLRGS